MVVGLIFEHQQPVLCLAVDIRVHMDGAGVDLLALVQFRQHSPLFQDFCANGGQIHQGLGTFGRLFRAVDLHAGVQIAPVGGLNGLVVDLHPVKMGGEGGVAAVVGPVGIHHPDLGNGGIPPLLIPEIGLQKLQIVQIHGKAQIFPQGVQPGGVHGGKASDGADGSGNRVLHPQTPPGSPPG